MTGDRTSTIARAMMLAAAILLSVAAVEVGVYAGQALAPRATYDQQTWEIWNVSGSSVSTNATIPSSIAGNDVRMYVLLNGYTDGGRWYQLGVVRTSGSAQFGVAYENWAGNYTQPATDTAANITGGDMLNLTIHIGGGYVTDSILDYNSGYSYTISFPDAASTTMLPHSSDQTWQYFTGPMQEDFKTTPVYGVGGDVSFTRPGPTASTVDACRMFPLGSPSDDLPDVPGVGQMSGSWMMMEQGVYMNELSPLFMIGPG